MPTVRYAKWPSVSFAFILWYSWTAPVVIDSIDSTAVHYVFLQHCQSRRHNRYKLTRTRASILTPTQLISTHRLTLHSPLFSHLPPNSGKDPRSFIKFTFLQNEGFHDHFNSRCSCCHFCLCRSDWRSRVARAPRRILACCPGPKLHH